jgi:hypothetical protein
LFCHIYRLCFLEKGLGDFEARRRGSPSNYFIFWIREGRYGNEGAGTAGAGGEIGVTIGMILHSRGDLTSYGDLEGLPFRALPFWGLSFWGEPFWGAPFCGLLAYLPEIPP